MTQQLDWSFEMPNNLKRISNTDLFVDQYKWNGTNFPAGRKDHVEFRKKKFCK